MAITKQPNYKLVFNEDTRLLPLEKRMWTLTIDGKPSFFLQKQISGIDTYWVNDRTFFRYTSCPLPKNGVYKENEKEDWLRHIDCYIHDLLWHIKLPYQKELKCLKKKKINNKRTLCCHTFLKKSTLKNCLDESTHSVISIRFWSQMKYSRESVSCFSSYLNTATKTWLFRCLHCDSEVQLKCKTVHYLAYIFLRRLTTYQESQENFMAPEKWFDMLYMDQIIKTQDIFSICVLFNNDNIRLRLIVSNLLNANKHYMVEMQMVIGNIFKVFYKIEQYFMQDLGKLVEGTMMINYESFSNSSIPCRDDGVENEHKSATYEYGVGSAEIGVADNRMPLHRENNDVGNNQNVINDVNKDLIKFKDMDINKYVADGNDKADIIQSSINDDTYICCGSNNNDYSESNGTTTAREELKKFRFYDYFDCKINDWDDHLFRNVTDHIEDESKDINKLNENQKLYFSSKFMIMGKAVCYINMLTNIVIHISAIIKVYRPICVLLHAHHIEKRLLDLYEKCILPLDQIVNRFFWRISANRCFRFKASINIARRELLTAVRSCLLAYLAIMKTYAKKSMFKDYMVFIKRLVRYPYFARDYNQMFNIKTDLEILKKIFPQMKRKHTQFILDCVQLCLHPKYKCRRKVRLRHNVKRRNKCMNVGTIEKLEDCEKSDNINSVKNKMFDDDEETKDSRSTSKNKYGGCEIDLGKSEESYTSKNSVNDSSKIHNQEVENTILFNNDDVLENAAEHSDLENANASINSDSESEDDTLTSDEEYSNSSTDEQTTSGDNSANDSSYDEESTCDTSNDDVQSITDTSITDEGSVSNMSKITSSGEQLENNSEASDGERSKDNLRKNNSGEELSDSASNTNQDCTIASYSDKELSDRSSYTHDTSESTSDSEKENSSSSDEMFSDNNGMLSDLSDDELQYDSEPRESNSNNSNVLIKENVLGDSGVIGDYSKESRVIENEIKDEEEFGRLINDIEPWTNELRTFEEFVENDNMITQEFSPVCINRLIQDCTLFDDVGKLYFQYYVWSRRGLKVPNCDSEKESDTEDEEETSDGTEDMQILIKEGETRKEELVEQRLEINDVEKELGLGYVKRPKELNDHLMESVAERYIDKNAKLKETNNEELKRGKLEVAEVGKEQMDEGEIKITNELNVDYIMELLRETDENFDNYSHFKKIDNNSLEINVDNGQVVESNQCKGSNSVDRSDSGSEYEDEDEANDIEKYLEYYFNVENISLFEFLQEKCITNSESEDDYMEDAGDTEDTEDAVFRCRMMNSLPEEEASSLISSVVDIFPNLGDGFVKLCLEYYNCDSAAVIDAMLLEHLPEFLKEIDSSLQMSQLVYSEVEEESSKDDDDDGSSDSDSSSGSSSGDSKKNKKYNSRNFIYNYNPKEGDTNAKLFVDSDETDDDIVKDDFSDSVNKDDSDDSIVKEDRHDNIIKEGSDDDAPPVGLYKVKRPKFFKCIKKKKYRQYCEGTADQQTFNEIFQAYKKHVFGDTDPMYQDEYDDSCDVEIEPCSMPGDTGPYDGGEDYRNRLPCSRRGFEDYGVGYDNDNDDDIINNDDDDNEDVVADKNEIYDDENKCHDDNKMPDKGEDINEMSLDINKNSKDACARNEQQHSPNASRMVFSGTFYPRNKALYRDNRSYNRSYRGAGANKPHDKASYDIAGSNKVYNSCGPNKSYVNAGFSKSNDSAGPNKSYNSDSRKSYDHAVPNRSNDNTGSSKSNDSAGLNKSYSADASKSYDLAVPNRSNDNTGSTKSNDSVGPNKSYSVESSKSYNHDVPTRSNDNTGSSKSYNRTGSSKLYDRAGVSKSYDHAGTSNLSNWAGSSKSYDTAGQSRYYDRAETSKSYDTADQSRYYDRAGPSKSYDTAGQSRYYDRAETSKSYDTADQSRYYDRAGPSKSYDTAGQSRYYDRAETSKSYDTADQSRYYDRAGPSKSYDTAGQSRYYDRAETSKSYDTADQSRYYDRAGPSKSYDTAGQSRYYDRAGRSKSYDTAGPSRFYDRADHSKSYDSGGPSESYDRVGNSKSYDTAGPSRSYNRAGSSKSYDTADHSRRYDHTVLSKSNNRASPSKSHDCADNNKSYNRSGLNKSYVRGGPGKSYDRGGPSKAYDRGGPSKSYDRTGPSKSYDSTGAYRSSNTNNSRSCNKDDDNRNDDNSNVHEDESTEFNNDDILHNQDISERTDFSNQRTNYRGRFNTGRRPYGTNYNRRNFSQRKHRF